jgi:hypothetical protein
MKDHDNRLLSERRAAALAGVGAKRLRLASMDGSGPPHFNFAGRRYYRPGDVLAWLDKHLVVPERADARAA